jgi:UDP-N-acetylmuramoyl-tripeptide--D-alanyl-D-alanine ligase
VHLRNISYSSSGAQFEVVAKDWNIELQTSLVGRYNLSNLTASVIVAKELGLTDQQIKIGVSRVEQVEHRLSIKRQPSGITIIDDAFNSNPYGAQMALEVLSGFPSKRIVVTPGMIELGDKQFEENKKFGVQIARSADIAIVVNKVNADAITEGLREGGMEHSKIMVAKNLFEATTILNKISAAGDTILYENDLPDMFK